MREAVTSAMCCPRLCMPVNIQAGDVVKVDGKDVKCPAPKKSAPK
jgi:hypothetical protein